MTPRNYDDIRALAAETGRRIPDLLALARTNDPFYIGPTQTKHAQWFAGLWERFGLSSGVHLRRIHYKLVSQPEPVLMVDGSEYQNSEKCWAFLAGASKAARCLGLVSANDFIDARNPDAVIVREYRESACAPFAHLYCDDDGEQDWRLPYILSDFSSRLDWRFPEASAIGYFPHDGDQPFHLEMISEKSTMDDVLVPLCGQLGVNYAPATGFQSITGVITLLQRVRQAKRPGVVFYVSDFDPAGSFMPPSVARQIEFWLPEYAPGLDVLLLPIVLTGEQVRAYGLPPIPIKETDRRQAGFLDRYGVEGATELDALEALHPGELRRVVMAAVAPYRDRLIDSHLMAVSDLADGAVRRQWEAQSADLREKLDEMAATAAAISAKYQDDLEKLRDAMESEMAPIREELDAMKAAIKERFAATQFDLPERPVSPIGMPERFDGLFDSRRDYLEQLRCYKRAPAEERAAGDGTNAIDDKTGSEK